MFAAVKQRAALWTLPSYTACVQHLAQQIHSTADCIFILSVYLRSNLSSPLAYILASYLSLHTPIPQSLMLPSMPEIS